MTNYYIRSINQDGTGEVVIPEFDKPHKGENAIIHDVWNNHLSSLPPVGIASKELTKSNGVGFVRECDVLYQEKPYKRPWRNIEKTEYCRGKYILSGLYRLYLTPKVSAPTQEQLQEEVRRLREALEGLMKGVEGLPPLTAIAGTLTKQYEAARTALQQTNKT